MLLSDMAGPTLAGILSVPSSLTHSFLWGQADLCLIGVNGAVTLFLKTYFMTLW